MNRLLLAALAFAGITMAQQAPAGWKVMKSEKGTCQINVPNDWTFDTAPLSALDPKKLFTAMILHEVDAKMDPEAYRLAAYHPIKIFENTSKRLILEDRVNSFGPMPPRRKMVGQIPQSTKGVCQAMVIFKAGGSEELAKQIVQTVSTSR
ncbi:MAG: hypothetical protein LLG20_11970 [Acidobacteriales bacterium]|nr:hypothetical protein [Terriglobales bacterium]